MDEPASNDPGTTAPVDGPDGTDEHRMPGWVKGFVVAGIVLVVLVVVALVFGGEHGPGRHLPGGGDAEVDPRGGHEAPFDHG